MSEIRTYLKSLLSKRITIRGRINKFDRDFKDRTTVIGKACIAYPVDVSNEQEICDHVWVIGTNRWPDDYLGELVQFTAFVYSYKEYNKANQDNFGLRDPTNLSFPDGRVKSQPPAIRVPSDPIKPTSNGTLPHKISTIEKLKELKSELVMPPKITPSLEDIKRVQKTLGGQGRKLEGALNTLIKFKELDMSIDLVIECIKAYMELTR